MSMHRRHSIKWNPFWRQVQVKEIDEGLWDLISTYPITKLTSSFHLGAR